MKKINDLTSLRNDKIKHMESLIKNPTQENRGLYLQIDMEVRKIDEEIKSLQEQERAAKNILGASMNLNNTTNMTNTLSEKSLRAAFAEAIETNSLVTYNVELRVEPMLSTSNTDILTKTVENIDVMYSPSEELLKNLGVRMINAQGMGNVVVPNMGESTASYVNETSSSSDASMNVENIVLTPTGNRVTITQGITYETLKQTTNLTQTIGNALYESIWKAAAEKLFDNIDTDATTQVKTITGATLSFNDIVMMEASLGRYNLTRPAYVMAPETKAFCKKTAALTNQEAIWKNNVVNEYPAFATPAVNGERIYMGDWTKVAVATWGPVQIIIDPFTHAREGIIECTAIAFIDSGIQNKRAFCIISDASTF